jgi:hypothetical protein
MILPDVIKKSIIKSLSVILVFLVLMFFSINLSLKEEEEIISSQIKEFIYGWWIALAVGIMLLAFGIATRNVWWRVSKYILYSGVVAVFVGIILAEFAYLLIPKLLPSLGLKFSVKKCEEFFFSSPPTQQPQQFSTTQQKIDPIMNIINIPACIFAGYVPSDYSIVSIAVFVIFMLILPLAILYSLFYDFSDFLSIRIRKVVALSAALISYRALISSFFIDFLTFGFGGIALLFFNYLLFGWGIRWVRGMFAHIHYAKTIFRVQDISYLQDLYNKRDKLLKEKEFYLSLPPDQAQALNAAEKIKEIDKQIKEIEKEIHKMLGRVKGEISEGKS